MSKAKPKSLRTTLKEVPAGYYITPAVFNRDVPYVVHRSRTPTTEFSYKTEQMPERYTRYTFTEPGWTVRVLTDSYRKVDNNRTGPTVTPFREMLRSPFGLVNWTENPVMLSIPEDKIIIQDSGGFQIAAGIMDFLSPEDVLNAHYRGERQYLGVSLDTPLGAFWTPNVDKTVRRRMALMTRNTNQYFENQGYTTYLNVNHGMTLRERVQWFRDSVTKENMAAGLCIGGFRSNAVRMSTPKTFASAIVRLLKESGYRHIHMLGATASWQMIIMAAIAARHNVVITSDSSTWIQLARTGAFLDNNLKVVQHPKHTEPESKRNLYCQCPACTLSHTVYNSVVTTYFALAHNLLKQDKVAGDINDMFANNPGMSVEGTFAYTNDRMVGLDPYVSGEKSVPDDELLLKPKGGAHFNGSLWGRKGDNPKKHARLLSILDAYDAWFNEHL